MPKAGQFKDLTNLRFGELRVVGLAREEYSPSLRAYKRYWNCACDCGNDTIVFGSYLTCNETRTCGHTRCRTCERLFASPRVLALHRQVCGLSQEQWETATLQRFYSLVTIDQETDCHTWEGGLGGNGGYGSFRVRGTTVRAHRFIYELLIGRIPNGLELDHSCRNRRCVNVAHLEPVTHAENMRRSKEATKTHCLRGHELSGRNLYFTPKAPTRRNCRACNNLRNKQSKKRGNAYVAGSV